MRILLEGKTLVWFNLPVVLMLVSFREIVVFLLQKLLSYDCMSLDSGILPHLAITAQNLVL